MPFGAGRLYRPKELCIRWRSRSPAGRINFMRVYIHTHTHINGPLSGTARVSRYQKVKPIWILLKQEIVSGSGISWAVCKSALRSR